MIFNGFIISTNHLIRMENLSSEKMPAEKFQNSVFEKKSFLIKISFSEHLQE